MPWYNAAQRLTQRAEAEARTAKETTRFLVDLFKISDPSEARGNTVTAREMLDKGATRVDTELSKVPAIQATLMHTLGLFTWDWGCTIKRARCSIAR